MLDLVFQDKEVRIVGSPKDPLFVARDLAEGLGLSASNLSNRLSKMPDEFRGDDFTLSDTIGRLQSYSTVRAEGMLFLVLRSDKEEAKEFQLWAMKVLKEVMTTGSYQGKPLEGEQSRAELKDSLMRRMEAGEALGYHDMPEDLYFEIKNRVLAVNVASAWMGSEMVGISAEMAAMQHMIESFKYFLPQEQWGFLRALMELLTTAETRVKVCHDILDKQGEPIEALFNLKARPMPTKRDVTSL